MDQFYSNLVICWSWIEILISLKVEISLVVLFCLHSSFTVFYIYFSVYKTSSYAVIASLIVDYKINTKLYLSNY